MEDAVVDLLKVEIVEFFFFFQAEDGIRDVAVTGVQTCALPISLPKERHHQIRRCRFCCPSPFPFPPPSRCRPKKRRGRSSNCLARAIVHSLSDAKDRKSVV